MRRVSQVQMKKLLDLLSEEGVIVHGKLMYTDTSRQSFWKKVSVELNSIQEGAFKNAFKWCKMWADWKNKTKRKADILFKKKTYGFMPKPQTLTNLELRLLMIIGYPLNDYNIDSHSDMMHKVDISENTENSIHLEFLTEESNEEDNKAMNNFTRQDIHNADVIKITDAEYDVYDELSDPGSGIKRQGKKTENKLDSFAEYRIRTKLLLEKERCKQKTEELRLRAIELKLKGEELRLKEAEMNKVNYLTGIEEEKLKCFKEITTSLKELSERTKNGN